MYPKYPIMAFFGHVSLSFTIKSHQIAVNRWYFSYYHRSGIIIVVIIILSSVSHRISDILYGRRATERNLSAEEFVIQDQNGSKWLLQVFWRWTHSILFDLEGISENQPGNRDHCWQRRFCVGILYHNFFNIGILGTNLDQIRYAPDIKASFSLIRTVINAKSYGTLRYWLIISAFLYMSPDISEIQNWRQFLFMIRWHSSELWIVENRWHDPVAT